MAYVWVSRPSAMSRTDIQASYVANPPATRPGLLHWTRTPLRPSSDRTTPRNPLRTSTADGSRRLR